MILASTFLEFVGICAIGTVLVLALMFIVEIGKEILQESLKKKDDDSDLS